MKGEFLNLSKVLAKNNKALFLGQSKLVNSFVLVRWQFNKFSVFLLADDFSQMGTLQNF